MPEANWESIRPRVHAEAEFFEITNDFGNPLELLREAISNAIDWNATEMSIAFEVQDIEGKPRLVITLQDNGSGMTKEVVSNDFWGLGFSPSRERKKANKEDTPIGQKGHGTKIFLRSERVVVKTQSAEGAFESVCDGPLAALAQHKLHEPKVRPIDRFLDKTGTIIEVIGYNDNERSKFVQAWVRDYIYWFTKIGSVERIFGIDKLSKFSLRLKSLDSKDYETLAFGHPFPEEDSDINKLFKTKGFDAADYYVRRFVRKDVRLKNHPEVTYDAIISVEGDAAKRAYNPMIRDRRRQDTGRYKVADRYGIWLCRDFIPVDRVNDWISGFGTGSNAFVLLHGFVNCQHLKLTANRGTIANTDPLILEELRTSIQDLISEIDAALRDDSIYTLRDWQEEEITLKQETTEFTRRVKILKTRRIARYKDRILVEPQNEAELFSLFMVIYTLHPELFEFQPLDYNTSRGIDLIGRNKSDNKITDGEHWYIELKHLLRNQFNHAFKNLRWIICWDFDRSVTEGTELTGVEENDTRKLKKTIDNGKSLYFLDSAKKPHKIQIIRLREFLKAELAIEFQAEPQKDE
jgi:hypothetical protein